MISPVAVGSPAIVSPLTSTADGTIVFLGVMLAVPLTLDSNNSNSDNLPVFPSSAHKRDVTLVRLSPFLPNPPTLSNLNCLWVSRMLNSEESFRELCPHTWVKSRCTNDGSPYRHCSLRRHEQRLERRDATTSTLRVLMFFDKKAARVCDHRLSFSH